jgi:predicted DNA-binding protein YlxM (UPF0122 family)
MFSLPEIASTHEGSRNTIRVVIKKEGLNLRNPHDRPSISKEH